MVKYLINFQTNPFNQTEVILRKQKICNFSCFFEFNLYFVIGHVPYKFQRNRIVKTEVIERKSKYCNSSCLSGAVTPDQIDAYLPFRNSTLILLMVKYLINLFSKTFKLLCGNQKFAFFLYFYEGRNPWPN